MFDRAHGFDGGAAMLGFKEPLFALADPVFAGAGFPPWRPNAPRLGRWGALNRCWGSGPAPRREARRAQRGCQPGSRLWLRSTLNWTPFLGPRGGLPTSSQGHCGAVTPQGGGALVALVLECSAVLVPSTAQGRGAPLRCAPFGVTSTARGALPGGRSGRRDGRHGRTKGWDQGQAAAASAACSRLKGVWVLSMAQATARSRSATLRRARPWL